MRRTTPSHWARCARELSGVARGTRNCRSFSTRPRTGHRVEWRGFADVLRGLGSRSAAACSTPRPRRKTSDASGGEEAGKLNAVLCGLRTSVFFVIREATVGIGCRSLFGLFNQRVLSPFRAPSSAPPRPQWLPPFRARGSIGRLYPALIPNK